MPTASRCRQLLQSLSEAVRDTLARTFPFLKWRASAPRDTILFTWRDGATINSGAILVQYVGQDASTADTLPVEFETRQQFNNRDFEFWEDLATVRTAWLQLLSGALSNGDLLPRVLGRIPLDAQVRPILPKRVLVATNPDSIGAEAPPTFEVPVHVEYSPDSINANGAVALSDCNTSGVEGFTCPIKGMRIESVPRIGSGLDSVLTLGRLTWKQPRLVKFTARARSNSTAGSTLVLPRQP